MSLRIHFDKRILGFSYAKVAAVVWLRTLDPKVTRYGFVVALPLQMRTSGRIQ